MWTTTIAAVNAFVWGPPMMAAFLGVGLFFTVRLGFFQVTRAPLWLKSTLGSLFRSRRSRGGISQFQSMTTALAATVGTGNIAGVATAIALGGPGAVFWMWVAAALGMMTGFAENTLGILYRVRTAGGWRGGPMYYMERGLGLRWLAILFCVCCIPASLGAGCMLQSHSIAAGFHSEFSVPPAVTGAVVALLAGAVIFGGVSRIGAVTEKLVPAMVVLYLAAGAACLVVHRAAIPQALHQIVAMAFTPRAGAAGAGYGMLQALRLGVSRGLFSNEAGLGSSVMVHAASDVEEPVQQGMWSVFEVFVDTLVVCTMTALVILTAGVYDPAAYGAAYAAIGDPGGPLSGVALTAAAFRATLGAAGGKFLAVALIFFAFSTILGWSWYGRCAWSYAFGEHTVSLFLLLYVLAAAAAAQMPMDAVWGIADAANGCMALPNLIAVVMLSGTVVRETRRFLSQTV